MTLQQPNHIQAASAGIRITDATVAFHTNHHETQLKYALNNVNLHIPYGSFTAVVGCNGSGKSTLAQVIAGLLPLSRGHVTYASFRDIHKPIVQLIFQSPDAQIIGETVYEDLCFGLENYCFSVQDMKPTAISALQAVGMEGFLDRPVTTLSGGQKALLSIASALAVGAQVLIFDESTAMLDPLSRQQVLDLAHQLQQTGTTIIWVTQWMNEVTEAERIIGLADGGVQFDGSPQTFFYGNACSTSDRTATPCEQLHLRPPYVVEVAANLRRNGVSLKHLPLTMNALVSEALRG